MLCFLNIKQHLVFVCLCCWPPVVELFPDPQGGWQQWQMLCSLEQPSEQGRPSLQRRGRLRLIYFVVLTLIWSKTNSHTPVTWLLSATVYRVSSWLFSMWEEYDPVQCQGFVQTPLWEERYNIPWLYIQKLTCFSLCSSLCPCDQSAGSQCSNWHLAESLLGPLLRWHCGVLPAVLQTSEHREAQWWASR